MDQITNTLQVAISTFTSIPGSTWAAFGALLGSGAVVSVVAELYKRHYINKKEVAIAKSFIGLILVGLSGVVTLAQSVVMYGAVNPHFLGQHTPQVLGFASAVYLFGGSKTYKKVASFTSRLKAAFDSLDANGTTAPITAPVASTQPDEASAGDLLT